MDFDSHVRAHLRGLERQGLLRQPRSLRGPQGAYIEMDGRRVLCLCSNNYLGLANHPAIRAAARTAVERCGYGSGASRHISGSEATHLAAQVRLSRFVSQPAGLFFSSGYAANVGAVQALVGRGDLIFSDALNHASMIDGGRLSRATVHVFRHRDLNHLQMLLLRHRQAGRAAIVLTESVFSMDGDVADLPGLRSLCDAHEAGLVVDEAHALGVLGPQGKGLCAALDVKPDVLIGPLGKAFGVMGAIVGGTPETVRLIENRARSYVFSTAPPPSQAAAAIVAADLIADAHAQRQTVMQRIGELARGLQALGYRVADPQCPILAVHIGPPDATMAISAALLEHGVFVHGIRPPTVPPGTSRLRVTAMADHTATDIEAGLAAFRAVRSLLPEP